MLCFVVLMQSSFSVRDMDSALNCRLQTWPLLLQPRRNFGHVYTAPIVCLIMILITTLFALHVEVRYVIWILFVMNAAIGLHRNEKCLFLITAVYRLGASINSARLGYLARRALQISLFTTQTQMSL